MSTIRQDYEQLIRSFLDGEIAADQFQESYLRKFKDERRSLDESTYQILDRLFGDADAFCGDPDLYRELSEEHPGSYLDEKGLRSAAAAALRELRTG